MNELAHSLNLIGNRRLKDDGQKHSTTKDACAYRVPVPKLRQLRRWVAGRACASEVGEPSNKSSMLQREMTEDEVKVLK